MSDNESERMSGTASATRFVSTTRQHGNPPRDVAEVLDNISRTLSAIDRKLEALIARNETDSAAVAILAASLECKPKTPTRR